MGRGQQGLFENTRMSFGEHLEELRKVLIRSIIGVAIGTGVGLFFSDQVLLFLQKPLNSAIQKFEKGEAQKKLVEEFGWLPPEFDVWFQAGQIPQKFMVDPAELVLGLREVDPGFFGQIEVRPYQFRSDHFHRDQIPTISKIMVSGTEGETPSAQQAQARVLFRLLSPEDQAKLKSLAKLSGIPSDSDVTVFVQAMNSLLDAPEINQGPEFQNLFASSQGWYESMTGTPSHPGLDGMKKDVDQEFDVILNRRLNRLLINRVFAQQMPPLKLDLAPIVAWREVDTRPQSLGITEPFMIWLKAGLITGLFLSSPWVFYQLWSFVAAGLYPHEQRYIHIYLPISLGLFLSGLLLAYFFVFDPVLQFLFAFSAQSGISPQPRINDWLGFVLLLPLGFGVAFQLPLVMLFLNRIGILDVATYISKWRIAVMVIFVLSMFLTPADPISLLLMAIPLTFLYFLGIMLCKWMPGNRKPFEDEPLPVV
jgi:sec-independent protein translocase protein TatC